MPYQFRVRLTKLLTVSFTMKLMGSSLTEMTQLFSMIKDAGRPTVGVTDYGKQYLFYLIGCTCVTPVMDVVLM